MDRRLLTKITIITLLLVGVMAYAVIYVVSRLQQGAQTTTYEEPEYLFEIAPEIDFIQDFPVGEVVAGNVIEQTLVCPFDQLYRLYVLGATYKRDNTGTVTIELIKGTPENEEEQIYKWDLDVSEFIDDERIELVFEKKTKGYIDTPMFIRITSEEAEPGNAVTFWSSRNDYYEDGSLSINGYSQYGDLWFQLSGWR